MKEKIRGETATSLMELKANRSNGESIMKDRIKIMGAYWDIIPVDNDNPLEHEHSGSCHFKKGKIYIDIDWPKKYVIRTIVHEVIHVLDYDLKLGLDEPTIVRLSTGLIESGIIDEELFLPILNRKEEK